jgi:hypothetical protein
MMRKLNWQSMCHIINVTMINCVQNKLDLEECIDWKFVGSFLSPVDRYFYGTAFEHCDVAGHSNLLQSAIMEWVYKLLR